MKLVTAPSLEPLTLDEAKEHLRVYGTEDDAYILRLISAARSVVEAKTGIQIMPAAYEAPLADFRRRHALKGPVLSVESVTYQDAQGVTHTLTNVGEDLENEIEAVTYYTVDDYSFPPTLAFTRELVPEYFTGGTLRVRYTAGFETVPEDIKQALLLIVGSYFENRQEEVAGISLSRLSFGVDALLAPYVVYA